MKEKKHGAFKYFLLLFLPGVLAAACHNLSGAARQLPLKGEPRSAAYSWNGTVPSGRVKTSSNVSSPAAKISSPVWMAS